jgi:hypothetical protein
MFVGNKIAGKNTAIDGEIRRLPALNENTVLHSNIKDFKHRSNVQGNEEKPVF